MLQKLKNLLLRVRHSADTFSIILVTAALLMILASVLLVSRSDRRVAASEARLHQRDAELARATELLLEQRDRADALAWELAASDSLIRRYQHHYQQLVTLYEKKINAHPARTSADIARLITARAEAARRR